MTKKMAEFGKEVTFEDMCARVEWEESQADQIRFNGTGQGEEHDKILIEAHLRTAQVYADRAMDLAPELPPYVPGPNDPPPGSWADIARIMADGDDSGFDWDAWKDEMKETDGHGY